MIMNHLRAVFQPSHLAMMGLIMVSFLFFSQVFSQTSAQASEDHLTLQNTSGKVKKIPKGARINVYGPEGTLPIKGRLVSVGDSITINRTGNKGPVKVPVDSVRGVKRVVLAVVLIAIYFALTSLYSVAIAFVAAAFLGSSLIFAIGIAAAAMIPYAALTLLFLYLGLRRYFLPKWKIVKPTEKPTN